MLHSRYQTWLIPYLENTLDDARRAQLEARLLTDSALAAELDVLRRATGKLRAVATPSQVSSSSVWPAVQARLSPAPRVSLAPRRRLAWAGGLAALAAAIVFVTLRPVPQVLVASGPDSVGPLPKTSPPKSAAAPPNIEGSSRAGRQAPPVRVAQRSAAPVVVPDPFLTIPLPTVKLKGGPSAKPPVSPRAKFALRPSEATSGVVKTPTVKTLPGKKSLLAAPPPVLMADRLPADVQNGNPFAADSERTSNAPAPVHIVTGAQKPETPPGAAGGSAFRAGGFGGGAASSMPASVQAGVAPAASAGRLASPARLEDGRAAPEAMATAKQAQRKQSETPETRAQTQWMSGDRRQALNGWQDALERAVKPPLYGTETGASLATKALETIRDAGALDAFRQLLERRRALLPGNLTLARLLAVTDDFSDDSVKARESWERVAKSGKASPQDWLQLAEAEEKAGDDDAARASYQRVLGLAAPPALKDAARKRLAEPVKLKAAP